MIGDYLNAAAQMAEAKRHERMAYERLMEIEYINFAVENLNGRKFKCGPWRWTTYAQITGYMRDFSPQAFTVAKHDAVGRLILPTIPRKLHVYAIPRK